MKITILRRIVLIALSLNTIAYAGFDISDHLIIKGGKTAGALVGGAAAGIGVGSTVRFATEKSILQAEEKKYKVSELNRLRAELQDRVKNIFIPDIQANRAKYEEWLIQELQRQKLSVNRTEIDAYTPEELFIKYNKFLGPKTEELRTRLVQIKEIEDKLPRSLQKISTGPSAGELEGLATGTSIGLVGAVGGAIAGAIIADKAAFAVVVKKHGVSKNIVKVAYATNVSLSTHKELLKAAQAGNKAKAISLLTHYYHTLFGQNGIAQLRTLLSTYDETNKLMSKYRKEGVIAFFREQLERKMGREMLSKFSNAISVSAAVTALLNKKSYREAKEGQYYKVKATKQLLDDLF